MIIFDHVSKVYPNGTVGLDDVDLTIQDGEFVAIIGRSGAGKSTLLRSVNRMHQITSGTLTVNGTDVSTLSGKSLRRFRRGIGMVFQSFNLVTRTTVIKNVLSACVPDMPFWRVLLGAFRKADKIKALESLDKVGILDKAYIRADQLSGGQQQRVALARALVTRPSILLLDEPLSNLDAKLRVEMQVEIKRIQKELGITTIIVTHDHEEAVSLADRVIVMNAGYILQIGKPQEVFDRPASPFIADFMGFSTFLHGIAAGAEGDMRLIRCGAHTLQVPAEAAQELSEGDACILAIRSENIRTAEQEGVNTVRGTVKSATYKGHTTRLEVSGCFEEMVYPAIHEYADVQEGSEVLLHFPAQHFCVYKDIK